MIEEYRTLAGAARHEIDKVRGSRFLAEARPAASDAQAQAAVAALRREHHDARHGCWAYRLGPGGERARSSDDGEPSGSAGRPILQRIEAAELTDVVVVVTRWFGGVKLGTGGLARAYAAAAAAVLERAPARSVRVTRRVRVEHAWEQASAVQRAAAVHGLEPAEAEYGEVVCLAFDVPVARVEAFLRELAERGAGRVRARADPDQGG